MKCVNYRCLEHYDECEKNGCNHFNDIEDCDCVLMPDQSALSSPCIDGLSTLREILNICESTEQCGFQYNTDKIKDMDEAIDEILAKCNDALNRDK